MLRQNSLQAFVLVSSTLAVSWLGCAGKTNGSGSGGAGGLGGMSSTSTRVTSSSTGSTSITGPTSTSTGATTSGAGGTTSGAGGTTSSTSGMGGMATSSSGSGGAGVGGLGMGGAGGVAVTSAGGAGGGCAHDVCTMGIALDALCSACAGQVCGQDSFCCDPVNGAWDDTCVGEVDMFCNAGMCSGTGGSGAGGSGAGGSGAGGSGAGGSGAGGSSPVGLVINEVEYDNVGTDNAEYVEIFNAGAATASLSGISLMLVNGANNIVYTTVDLSPLGSINAGQYLVVGATSVVSTLPANVLKIDAGAVTNYIQNGAPDGVALVDTVQVKLLDALSYEGSIKMATVAPLGTISLIEGTVLPNSVADSNTVVGSLCRLPNGTDTNNAATDWAFSTTPTPGAANVP